jgi:hypothetical protein
MEHRTSPAAGAMFKLLAPCLTFLALSLSALATDHIHQLWYNGSIWQDQDLTALTSSPGTFGTDQITSFRTANKDLHVFYTSNDSSQHIHQLFWNGSDWTDQDLSAKTGGPMAGIRSLTGFAVGNDQYVFYISNADDHVHELSFIKHWVDQDLTALVDDGSTAEYSPMRAFVTKPDGNFHVAYIGNNSLGGGLLELSFNGTSWSNTDITETAGTYCFVGTKIGGFALNEKQYLYCDGQGVDTTNPDLLQFSCDGSAWKYTDVTWAAGGGRVPASGTGGISAIFDPLAQSTDVFSPDLNFDFNDYNHETRPSAWHDYDLTQYNNAPTDGAGGGVLALYLTEPQTEYQVFYAPTTEVYEAVDTDEGWTINDLTGGTGNADNTGDITGFVYGEIVHVFYQSND